MKKSIFIFIIFVSSVFLISTASADMNTSPGADISGTCEMTGRHGPKMGKGHEGMKGPGFFRGIGGITLPHLIKLDLTDTQKKDVANILVAHRDAYRQTFDRMTDERKIFFDTISSKDIPAESAVRDACKKMSATMEDLIVEKLEVMSAIKQVLSPDQFERLTSRHGGKADAHDRIRKKVGKRADDHREMMDTWINTYADAQN